MDLGNLSNIISRKPALLKFLGKGQGIFNAVNKHHPVEVVHLMLNDPS